MLICLPLKKQPLNYVQNLTEFPELNFVDTGDTGNNIDLLISSDYYWSIVTRNVKALEKKLSSSSQNKIGMGFQRISWYSTFYYYERFYYKWNTCSFNVRQQS